MNKKFARILAVMGCATIALTTFAFTGCGDGSDSGTKDNNDTSGGGSSYTVTYNLNYSGAPDSTTSNVASGESATTDDPTRDGYTFEGWYTDADCTVSYKGSGITANTTLYANWVENETETSTDSTTEYVTYKFEAECVDLSDFQGNGYSGSASMTGAIIGDYDDDCHASGGWYVTYLYLNDDSTTLTFEINSSKEVFDATLKLRLSAEFADPLTFTWEEWQVIVNGEAIDYGSITIRGGKTDVSSDYVKPFLDKTITKTLHLKEGKNIIQLKTNNDNPMGGTMYATAPMVDCMKITTTSDVELTWDAIENKTPMENRDY
jgi:uncharacterized repeat protein (TIGR02543 family)